MPLDSQSMDEVKKRLLALKAQNADGQGEMRERTKQDDRPAQFTINRGALNPPAQSQEGRGMRGIIPPIPRPPSPPYNNQTPPAQGNNPTTALQATPAQENDSATATTQTTQAETPPESSANSQPPDAGKDNQQPEIERDNRPPSETSLPEVKTESQKKFVDYSRPQHRLYLDRERRAAPAESEAHAQPPAEQAEAVAEPAKTEEPQPEDNVDLMAEELLVQQKIANRKPAAQPPQQAQESRQGRQVEPKPQPSQREPERRETAEKNKLSATEEKSLFGEIASMPAGENAPQLPSQGNSLFDQLEAAAGEKPPSPQASAPANPPSASTASDAACPNCRKATKRTVFCPYCGGAMCASCAAGIKADAGKLTYVCPHCNEEVDIKKNG
ncbi:hypothetical protein HY995_05075 [Candidatus Micrarchaeota archaeon]|nr:hypothetical protein [Candidatus Micrarchaeota archaeon]